MRSSVKDMPIARVVLLEMVRRQDLRYRPSGRSIVVEEAVLVIRSSPHERVSQVLGHVVGKLDATA